MNDKHTPGPWEYTPTNTESVSHIIRASDGFAVAFATTHNAEVGANARLIAAAPDMLPFAALIASFPIREQFTDDIPVVGVDGAYITHGDVRKARAVIAKARGQS